MRLFAALLLGLSLSGAPVAGARTVHNVEIPEFVEIADWGQPMRLLGTAVVQRRFLPFYALGLYVPRHTPSRDEIVQGMATVRLSFHWLGPALDAEASATLWREEIGRQITDPSRAPVLAASIDRIARAIGPLSREDQFALDYQPDRGLRLWRNGRSVAQFPGLETNRLVLAIWFGPKAGDVAEGLLRDGAPQQPPPAAR